MTWNRARLHALLPPACPRETLSLVDVTDSTNLLARELADEGAPHGTLVAAGEQRGGRGRGGRTWYSPAWEGLWMSLLLRPRAAPSAIGVLPLAAGVAVARALESRFPMRIGLKWPNDVMVEGKKLAGILVETSVRADRVAWAVVGVGLNVATKADAFPEELRGRATSLAILGHDASDREELLAAITRELFEEADRVENGHGASCVRAFAARDVLCGRAVVIEGEEGRLSGEAAGIAETGALLLRTDGAVRPIHAGSVIAFPS